MNTKEDLSEWFKEQTKKAHREVYGSQSGRTLVDGIHNEHYGEMELEPLDVAEAWLTDEQLKGAYLFQLIKYLGRYNMAKEGKGGVADLKKMLDYLDRLIELHK
jgi:hypothetical protein